MRLVPAGYSSHAEEPARTNPKEEIAWVGRNANRNASKRRRSANRSASSVERKSSRSAKRNARSVRSNVSRSADNAAGKIERAEAPSRTPA